MPTWCCPGSAAPGQLLLCGKLLEWTCFKWAESIFLIIVSPHFTQQVLYFYTCSLSSHRASNIGEATLHLKEDCGKGWRGTTRVIQPMCLHSLDNLIFLSAWTLHGFEVLFKILISSETMWVNGLFNKWLLLKLVFTIPRKVEKLHLINA